MNEITKTESHSTFQVLLLEEVSAVAGGRINLYGDLPRPPRPPIEPGHGAGGYCLPEMEMDTGKIFLPF